jgi:hypothetical protein
MHAEGDRWARVIKETDAHAGRVIQLPSRAQT